MMLIEQLADEFTSAATEIAATIVDHLQVAGMDGDAQLDRARSQGQFSFSPWRAFAVHRFIIPILLTLANLIAFVG